jgi:hypothetical protein
MLCVKLVLLLVRDLPARDLDFFMIYAPNRFPQNCCPKFTRKFPGAEVHRRKIMYNYMRRFSKIDSF